MAEYIEFVLIDNHNEERNVKMNADDPNEVYLWRVKSGNRTLKKPYWRRCAIIDAVGLYSRINITKKSYQLHRVCYYAHNPEWDIYETSCDNSIDHIDRNPANNDISNLRAVTHSQNQENTNAKGYSYSNTRKCWVAHLTKDRKQYTKLCNTEAEAIAARAMLKEKYHTY